MVTPISLKCISMKTSYIGYTRHASTQYYQKVSPLNINQKGQFMSKIPDHEIKL